MDADFISCTSTPSTCNNKNFNDKVAKLKGLGAPAGKLLGEDSAAGAGLKLRASARASTQELNESFMLKQCA